MSNAQVIETPETGDPVDRFRNADRLWQLLEMALEDFKTLAPLTDRYQIVMSQWCCQRDSGICEICLAGASMIRRFDCYAIGLLSTLDIERMEVIDNVRRGWVQDAEAHLAIARGRLPRSVPKGLHSDYSMPQYGQPEWLPAMEAMLANLKAADF